MVTRRSRFTAKPSLEVMLSHRTNRRQDAFTLTEVLIAVFILAIGLMGVISVFPVGIAATQQTLARSARSLAARTGIAEFEYYVDAGKTKLEEYAEGAMEYLIYPGSTATDAYDVGVERYKWNAVLGTSPLSDDGDAGTDADRRLVLVQIACFEGDPEAFTGTATFAQEGAAVTMTSIPNGLSAGSYIRCTATSHESRWYRVEAINATTKVASLVEPFERTGGSGLTFLFSQDLYQTNLAVR